MVIESNPHQVPAFALQPVGRCPDTAYGIDRCIRLFNRCFYAKTRVGTDIVELVDHHKTGSLTHVINTTEIGQKIKANIFLEEGANSDNFLFLDNNSGLTAKLDGLEHCLAKLGFQLINSSLYTHNGCILSIWVKVASQSKRFSR